MRKMLIYIFAIMILICGCSNDNDVVESTQQNDMASNNGYNDISDLSDNEMLVGKMIVKYIGDIPYSCEQLNEEPGDSNGKLTIKIDDKLIIISCYDPFDYPSEMNNVITNGEKEIPSSDAVRYYIMGDNELEIAYPGWNYVVVQFSDADMLSMITIYKSNLSCCGGE